MSYLLCQGVARFNYSLLEVLFINQAVDFKPILWIQFAFITTVKLMEQVIGIKTS